MKSSFSDKTFILGIGAQKTGSTWLFDYFRTHPEIFVSSLKEIHYFDEAYRPDLCSGYGSQFARAFFKRLADKRDEDRAPYRHDSLDLGDRVRMNFDGDSAYADYFRKRVPDDIGYFCEISATYSLLREEGFRAIRRLFPNTKIIFIMRDPVDRHYSTLRMSVRKGLCTDDPNNFLRLLDNPTIYETGRYDLTVVSLLKVFGEQDLFFGFYETLFNEKEMKRLMAFLGIDYLQPDFTKRVNAGLPPRPLSQQEVEVAFEIYRPVYEFCTDFFGARVPASWLSEKRTEAINSRTRNDMTSVSTPSDTR